MIFRLPDNVRDDAVPYALVQEGAVINIARGEPGKLPVIKGAQWVNASGKGVQIGDVYDGEAFTRPAKPVAPAPEPGPKVYTWAEFVALLQSSGRAREVAAQKRKAANLAYDLETFFEIGRATGKIDFSDPFMRSVVDGLVGAGVLSSGAAVALMGPEP